MVFQGPAHAPAPVTRIKLDGFLTPRIDRSIQQSRSVTRSVAHLPLRPDTTRAMPVRKPAAIVPRARRVLLQVGRTQPRALRATHPATPRHFQRGPLPQARPEAHRPLHGDALSRVLRRPVSRLRRRVMELLQRPQRHHRATAPIHREPRRGDRHQMHRRGDQHRVRRRQRVVRKRIDAQRCDPSMTTLLMVSTIKRMEPRRRLIRNRSRMHRII